jgi:hypothetical protein
MNALKTILVAEAGAFVSTASARVHTLVCGLGGHDLLLNVEPARLSLKCSSCPYETEGWTVKRRSFEVRAAQGAPALVPHNVHG